MTTSDIFSNQRKIWREYKTFYTLARRSIPFIVGVVVGGLIFSSDSGYATNLYTELLSIAATVGILDFLNEQHRQQEQAKRDQWQAEQQRIRDQLQAVSELQRAKTKEERQAILDRMKSGGLLRGASLRSLNLEEVNLANADLRKSDLERANLRGANLQSARLRGANMKHANLSEATLMTAILDGVVATGIHLEKADLLGAELVDAMLDSAYLEEAKFGDSNLLGAELAHAKLSNTKWERIIGNTTYASILPDGTNWTKDVDMGRFTNPHHRETRDRINEVRLEMGLGPLYDWNQSQGSTRNINEKLRLLRNKSD